MQLPMDPWWCGISGFVVFVLGVLELVSHQLDYIRGRMSSREYLITFFLVAFLILFGTNLFAASFNGSYIDATTLVVGSLSGLILGHLIYSSSRHRTIRHPRVQAFSVR